MESKAAVINAIPPYGYIIANEKWRGSVLVQDFKGKANVTFNIVLYVLRYMFKYLWLITKIDENDFETFNYQISNGITLVSLLVEDRPEHVSIE